MDVFRDPDSREERISRMIRDHEKELLRLCCVYLKDLPLAEDAVQETFLKAYQKLDTFRGDSSPKTWLVRIAVNVCKDMRRTSWFRMLKNTFTLDQVQITRPEGSDEVHSELVAQIMNLPGMYKEMILLYYYEGFTLTEIAEVMKESVTTAHRRLEKAKALLKHGLKGENVHEA